MSNHKTMLCRNYLECNFCHYGNKCIFAHNYDEQKIDEYRKIIMELIESDIDLYNFDISDNNIIKNIMTMTNVCKNCVNKNCFGGYNCKNGVCDVKYKICKDDVLHGNCCNLVYENNTCDNGYHFTKRNMICYDLRLYIYPNMNHIIQDKDYDGIKHYEMRDDNIEEIQTILIKNEIKKGYNIKI